MLLSEREEGETLEMANAARETAETAERQTVEMTEAEREEAAIMEQSILDREKRAAERKNLRSKKANQEIAISLAIGTASVAISSACMDIWHDFFSSEKNSIPGIGPGVFGIATLALTAFAYYNGRKINKLQLAAQNPRSEDEKKQIAREVKSEERVISTRHDFSGISIIATATVGTIALCNYIFGSDEDRKEAITISLLSYTAVPPLITLNYRSRERSPNAHNYITIPVEGASDEGLDLAARGF